MQGGNDWIEAQRDGLSGLGAAEIPASSRQGEGASPLAQAQAVLALTANPRTMPCRDSERAAITSFVEDSLTAGQSHPCIEMKRNMLKLPYFTTPTVN